ncbi:MAG: hypothetical protein HPY53_11995 [Brevinematales bacterium]|nr:hypothetical protein [Brevinematales bacterium]
MRKPLVLMAVIALAVSLSVMAPSKGNASVAISINPFATIVPLLTGGIGLAGSVEFTLGGAMSLYIPVEFYSWSWGIGTSAYGWSYIGVGAMLHYYLADGSFNFGKADPLGGLWAGAGAGVQIWSGNYWGTTWSSLVINIPLEVGYKWFFSGNNGFYLEPFVGYNIAFGLGTSTWGTGWTTPSYGGVMYGVNLGFAF